MKQESGAYVGQSPFVIRSHHLGHYADLVDRPDNWRCIGQKAKSPKVVAENIRSSVKKEHDEKYIKDVLGVSEDSSGIFVNSVEMVFERFKALPDDYPAEVVEELSDEICKVCIVGEHCKTSPPKEIPSDLSLLEKIGESIYQTFILPRGQDQSCLDYFIKKTKKLELPKPTIAKEKVIYIDTKKTRVVRRAKTTMGILKKVLPEL